MEGGCREGGRSQHAWGASVRKSNRRETGEGSAGPAQGILAHSSTEQTANAFPKANWQCLLKKNNNKNLIFNSVDPFMEIYSRKRIPP